MLIAFTLQVSFLLSNKVLEVVSKFWGESVSIFKGVTTEK